MWVVAFATNGALSPPATPSAASGPARCRRPAASSGGWQSRGRRRVKASTSGLKLSKGFSHLPDRRDTFGKDEFRGDGRIVVAVCDLANFFARFGLAGSSTGWTGAHVRVRRTMRNLGRQDVTGDRVAARDSPHQARAGPGPGSARPPRRFPWTGVDGPPSGGQDTSRWRRPNATACARSRAPSLRYRLAACDFTASSEMPKASAMSRLDRPWLMPCRTVR